MKKILSLVLAAVLLCTAVLSFTACGVKDMNKITEQGYFVCGVTPFENMNEKDENGEWTIGFETEFAMAVARILGVEVRFQEIDWGQKYNELNSGAIDCIWNGFTANSSDEGIKRSDLVDFSYGYMLNQQCIVVKTENLAQFTDEASLNGKSACAESGSAGAAYAKDVTDPSLVVDSAVSQLAAFQEVKSGAVDFIVVDILLAQNLCGKGDFANLSIVESIELESEIYAIGFRKGSDMTEKVNAAIKQLEQDGTLAALAEKYGFENVLKVSETIE